MLNAAAQVVSLLIRAWLAMIFIGVVHAEIIPEVPAFAYWETFVFCMVFNYLVGPGYADIKAALDD